MSSRTFRTRQKRSGSAGEAFPEPLRPATPRQIPGARHRAPGNPVSAPDKTGPPAPQERSSARLLGASLEAGLKAPGNPDARSPEASGIKRWCVRPAPCPWIPASKELGRAGGPSPRRWIRWRCPGGALAIGIHASRPQTERVRWRRSLMAGCTGMAARGVPDNGSDRGQLARSQDGAAPPRAAPAVF